MNRQRTLLAAALSVLAACGADTKASKPAHAASIAPPPVGGVTGYIAPVGAADFLVAGVSDVMDSAAVRRTKGAPDSVAVEAFEDGVRLTKWRYGGMLVTFASTDTVFNVQVVAHGVATSRGLQVGDSVDRVLALYGAPRDSILVGAWEYDDSRDKSPGAHVIRIALVADRVVSIYFGWITD